MTGSGHVPQGDPDQRGSRHTDRSKEHTMTRHPARRLFTAVALATALPLALALPAQARRDAGTPHVRNPHCALERIDRQLVLCDDLTGGGVEAPLWVPVQE
jgi:hypothetical protein